MAIAFVLERWMFFIFSNFLDFSKKFLPPHEQKWLVMWERAGEA
jgi:hypothetical protein